VIWAGAYADTDMSAYPPCRPYRGGWAGQHVVCAGV